MKTLLKYLAALLASATVCLAGQTNTYMLSGGFKIISGTTTTLVVNGGSLTIPAMNVDTNALGFLAKSQTWTGSNTFTKPLNIGGQSITNAGSVFAANLTIMDDADYQGQQDSAGVDFFSHSSVAPTPQFTFFGEVDATDVMRATEFWENNSRVWSHSTLISASQLGGGMLASNQTFSGTNTFTAPVSISDDLILDASMLGAGWRSLKWRGVQGGQSWTELYGDGNLHLIEVVSYPVSYSRTGTVFSSANFTNANQIGGGTLTGNQTWTGTNTFTKPINAATNAAPMTVRSTTGPTIPVNGNGSGATVRTNGNFVC